MAVPAISSSFAAIASGVRAETRTAVLHRALDDAGVLDASLAAGLDAAAEAARGLTDAGLRALPGALAGTLLDILA